MPAKTTSSNAQEAGERSFEATAERIRELNERILESARKAGNVYLDNYERTLKSIADFQESVAEHTQVEWFANALSAQADLTREMAKLYTSAGREFINK